MRFTLLMVAFIWISTLALGQDAPTRTEQGASNLLKVLLSPQTSDIQWSAAEKSFDSLPPTVALPSLFREIAKGIPGGYSYAAHNCFDPIRDRKVAGGGRFCVVNSLWCKQLECTPRYKILS